MKCRAILSAGLAALVSMSGCVEEDLGHAIEEGVPVKVSLDLGTSGVAETVVTKAGSYSNLTSLILFIFNSTGERCEQIVETADGSLTLSSGTDGTCRATFSATSGIKRICAVGNYVSDNSWEYYNVQEGRWGSISEYIASLKELAEGGSSSAELGTRIFFLERGLSSRGNTPTFDEEQMISTGADVITIGVDGRASGNLYLDRCVADIQFSIKSEYQTTDGHTVTFEPTNYYLYNIPAGTRLAPGRGIETDPDESYREFYYDGSRKTINPPSEGVYSFQFFIPENIQEYADGCTSYSAREKWDSHGTDEAKPSHKLWTNAPLNATYVVINGNYSETDADGNLVHAGETSYTVHLGDFSGDKWGDFTVIRNHRYIYSMSVTGIESIRIEAQTDVEHQPGAEGSIVSTSENTRNYSLDSHFEQVYLEYDLSSIAEAAGNTMAASGGTMTYPEAISNHLIVTIETPFNSTAELKPYQSYSEGVDKETALSGLDYKWVEFWPQTGTAIEPYPGLPAWKAQDGRDSQSESAYLLDVYDACVKMGKVVEKIMKGESVSAGVARGEDGITVVRQNGAYVARFTGFVDEYYYASDPVNTGRSVSWGQFVNKTQRRMLISMDVKTSEDGNSSYSTVHTNISQRAMQSFYNTAATDLNGFGMETFNETPLSRYGTPVSSGSSDSDGRSNQRTMVYSGTRGWDYYLNADRNGYTGNVTGVRKLDGAYREGRYNNNVVRAYYACMSRNRDLDGDNVIDDDEVRWYLPSINEYLRLGMGSIAMSNESNLYIGDKSTMRRGSDTNGDGWPDNDNWYPENYYSDGVLYHTSTNGKETFWAVEKGAYGGVQTNADLPIRCIRHLPADPGNNSVPADPMYDLYTLPDGCELLDFRDKFDNNLYRPVRTDSQLNEHTEDDLQNRFYDGLVIGSKSPGGTAQLDDILNVGNSGENPCADYWIGSENDPVSGKGHWRVPNLAELTVMSANSGRFIVGNRNEYVYCCTRFSNEKVRLAFRWDGKQISCLGDKGERVGQSRLVAYRCVRDATPEDFASATPSAE